MKKSIKKPVVKKCPQCDGIGEIPLFSFYSECPKCSGSGEVRVLEVVKEIEIDESPLQSDPEDQYGWVMFTDFKIDDD